MDTGSAASRNITGGGLSGSAWICAQLRSTQAT